MRVEPTSCKLCMATAVLVRRGLSVMKVYHFLELGVLGKHRQLRDKRTELGLMSGDFCHPLTVLTIIS